MAPWRVAFILAGLVGLVLAAIFLPMREPRKKAGAVSSEAPRESRRANIAQGVGEMLREWRLFLPLYGGLAFYGMGVSIAVYWSPMVMTRVFGYSIEQTSKALGTGNIVWAALGSLSAGFVLDRVVRRWGSKGLLRFAGILAIVALPSVLAVFAGRGELALVLLTSIAFASCLFGSSMLSVIADVSPPQVRGLAISFYAFFMTLVGASLGPVLVAFLTEHVFHSDGAVGLSLAVIGTVAFAGCAVLMTLASVAIGRRA
ncbi:MFS transporter [Novosphingobium sp. 9]|uniref:MFS transporter n=1 Tax=Novosphingobium sp. 9 TaxID=2025349 RepID=UPI0021B57739|nr:MFS transporter [Novosphingobium sp. 9]